MLFQNTHAAHTSRQIASARDSAPSSPMPLFVTYSWLSLHSFAAAFFSCTNSSMLSELHHFMAPSAQSSMLPAQHWERNWSKRPRPPPPPQWAMDSSSFLRRDFLRKIFVHHCVPCPILIDHSLCWLLDYISVLPPLIQAHRPHANPTLHLTEDFGGFGQDSQEVCELRRVRRQRKRPRTITTNIPSAIFSHASIN